MKIYLDVYLDNNIGDDLMIKGILKRFNNFQFYTVNNDSVIQNSFSNYENINFVDKNKEKEILDQIDYYVTVGGSMFQYRSIGNIITKYKKIRKIKRLKKRNCKIFTFGSNLGPFLKFKSEKLAIKELNLNDFITVRDSKSFDFLEKNVKHSNYMKFDDIVLEMEELKDIKDSKFKKGKKILGISAYRSIHNSEYNLGMYQSLAKFAEHMMARDEFDQIYLFAFDTEQENDLSAATHINHLISENYSHRVKIIPYLGDEMNFLGYFSKCSLHLSIRFHSAILASLYEIPFIPISYSNKMIDYINDIDSTYTTIPIEKLSFSHREINECFLKDDFIQVKYFKKSGHFEEMKRELKND